MAPFEQSFIFEPAAFPNRSRIRITAAGTEFSEAINSSQWERPAPGGFLIKFYITFEGKLQVPLLLLGEEARRDHFHLSPVTVVVFNPREHAWLLIIITRLLILSKTQLGINRDICTKTISDPVSAVILLFPLCASLVFLEKVGPLVTVQLGEID